MGGFIAFLLKLGFGGVVDKAIDHMERRAEIENDRERLRHQTTIELAREAVKEAQIMADLNKAKMQHKAFWWMTGAFVAVLFVYFAANTAYNLLWCSRCAFPQNWIIAAYPAPLDEWAGRMIAWLFYVGTGVGALKALGR